MFMGTFHGLYYEMMVGSISSGFSDLVTIGERIKTGIKSGKISGGPSNAPYNSKWSASSVPKGKEGEINVAASQPRVQQPLVIPLGQQQGRRPPRKFDPLPMPPSQLLQQLVKASLVELKPLAPPVGPLPRRYDANARCEYHANSPGHTIEQCWPFKHKVQDLLDSQDITFEKPNITSDPTLSHDGLTINAIEVVTDSGASGQAKTPINSLK